MYTERWIRFENVEFHNTVDKDAFEKEHVIRLSPPDGCFFEVCHHYMISIILRLLHNNKIIKMTNTTMSALHTHYAAGFACVPYCLLTIPPGSGSVLSTTTLVRHFTRSCVSSIRTDTSFKSASILSSHLSFGLFPGALYNTVVSITNYLYKNFLAIIPYYCRIYYNC